MDPLTIGSAISGIVGGIGNFAAQSSAQQRATDLQNAQMQKWIQLNIPDPAEQKIALQQYAVTGKLTPALQQAISQSPSEFSKIVSDSRSSQAMSGALEQLQNLGSSGGMRLSDRANLADLQSSDLTDARASRNNIASNMAQRGAGGSGVGAAMTYAANQDQMDRNSNASLKTAASASDRALQAIQGAGTMGAQINNQLFNQDAQKASAQDAINQFNTTNKQNVMSANTSSENAANLWNANNQQDVANKNVGVANQEEVYNKGLLQQKYENEIQQLNGEGGAVSNTASAINQQGQTAGTFAGNLGSTGAAAFGAQANQNNFNTLAGYFGNKPAQAAPTPTAAPQSPNSYFGLTDPNQLKQNVNNAYWGN